MESISLLNTGPAVPRLRNGCLLKPPPLGILSLAAWLRSHGVTLNIADYQLAGGDMGEQLLPSRFASFIEEHSPAPIIGISTMGGMLPVVLMAVEEYKARHPEKTIILGGSGPAGVAAHILRAFPAVDCIFCGEGEAALLEFLEKNGDPSTVAGVVYREGDSIVENPARKRISDLDVLPVPAYDLIDMDRYAVVNVSTSRGCPYRCAFCESPAFWGKGVVYRSLDNVMNEIRELRTRWAKRQINLCDDTFVARRPRVEEFCRRVISEKLDFRWECFARVDLVDPDLMKLMAEAGCSGVFFGVESGSDSVLSRIDKRFTVARARDVISQAVKIFPHVYTSFVWGLPFETMEDFYDSILLMTEFGNSGVRVQRPHFSLRPGAPLFAEYGYDLAYSSSLPYHFLEVPRRFLPPEVEETIRRYPEIFITFYHITGLEFEEKQLFMRNLEALGEEKWRIMAEHLGCVVNEIHGDKNNNM
ncbi:MAG: hypothetical protein C1942_09115 [Prosthecochloris sp.]|uniref:B12-binding domain-containing radical SAM protein n=1 Tax=Prosthecochloris sp. TaxID=290513 RepID=UPI0013C730E3|nr:radical SAM protein [Prosthecochloris sp.]NEX12824.1 hypothetical protein [Prosthecochloris sp.]